MTTAREYPGTFDEIKDEPEPSSSTGNGADHGASRPAIDDLVTVCAADIQMKPIKWFWPGRFALGKVGLIGGMPEEGKSTVTLDIAARATRGDQWPCSSDRAPVGNVIILSAEDSDADTLVPRLAAAGADLRRVHIIKGVIDKNMPRLFSLLDDVKRLEKKIDEIGDVVLVIIDPLSAYLGVKRMDSYRTTDVRGALAPLAEMAERTMIAVIAVMHLNKNTALTNAINRFADSLAFIATARHAYLAIKDPNAERRLLLRAKNNLSAKTNRNQGLAYNIGSRLVDEAQEIIGSCIEWETAPVNMTADEALAGHAAATGGRTSGKAEAMELLRDLLANGPVPAKDVQKAGRDAGLTPKNIRDAKEALKIETEKPSLRGGWIWRLPAETDGAEHGAEPVNDELPSGAEIVGRAGPGERCFACGKGRDVYLIRPRPNAEVLQLHKACVE